MSGLLKLMAEDAEDLDIIGAAVQDALLRMGDLSFDPKARRFTAMLNRFRWETAEGAGPYERVRAALSFESVLGVKSRRVRPDAPDALGLPGHVDFELGLEPLLVHGREQAVGDGLQVRRRQRRDRAPALEVAVDAYERHLAGAQMDVRRSGAAGGHDQLIKRHPGPRRRP